MHTFRDVRTADQQIVAACCDLSVLGGKLLDSGTKSDSNIFNALAISMGHSLAIAEGHLKRGVRSQYGCQVLRLQKLAIVVSQAEVNTVSKCYLQACGYQHVTVM
jgi:hypothetical protein